MNNLHHLWIGAASPGGAKTSVLALTTVAFAAAARLLRGVTFSGAVVGGAICFLLMLAAGWGGFVALCAVFILTWGATRVGYRHKQRLGSAERRGGRNAGQVLANLGVAAALAGLYMAVPDWRWLIALSAALTEVTADTLASEIGLVIGGTPRLITTWRAAPIGTDGAITWPGTLASVMGAFLTSTVCVANRLFPVRYLPLCAAAGFIGMLTDSFLGATLERKRVLGNNSVNFLSTAVAATVAFVFA